MHYGDRIEVRKPSSNVDLLRGKVLQRKNSRFRVELDCGLRIWLDESEVIPHRDHSLTSP